MSEAAKAFGIGGKIAWEGKEYELSPFTVGMIAKFELWLENRAWEALERQTSRLGPAEYQKRCDQLVGAIAGGAYEWGSPAVEQAAQSRAGEKQILYLLLAEKNPDITPQFAAKIYEGMTATIAARIRSETTDPNSSSPAEEPGNP